MGQAHKKSNFLTARGPINGAGPIIPHYEISFGPTLGGLTSNLLLLPVSSIPSLHRT